MNHFRRITLFAIVACLFGNQALGLDVRLSGGLTPYEGRVEVYHGGQWGSVCDDKWTHVNCLVVCAQIGFSGGNMMHDTDAYGTCTGPILLDDVQCVGDEQNLGECVMSNFGEHNCDHKEDVGCKCDPNSTPSGTCVSANHRIHRVDSTVPWVGRAEVFVGGVWSAICDDHWDDLDAKVFCRCLGVYSQFDQHRAYWSSSLSTLPSLPLAYDNVRCTEVDGLATKNIWDCMTTPANGTCTGSAEAAGVACGPLPKAVTPAPPNVTLECDSGQLTSCFISSTYEMNADYLSMAPACAQATPRNITNGVCYDIDMDKCAASQVMSDHSEKNFCYDLSYTQFDSDPDTLLTDTVWSRRACCAQSKNGTAHTSFKPVLLPVESPISVSSPVNFTLDCYLDETFTGASLAAATTLKRGQDIFCKVTTGVWDDALYLVVPTCHFYGSPTGSPSFTFLANKCPTTEVLGMFFYNFEKHSWGFKFAAPKFQQHDDLYISCNAYVCDPNLDPKPYCDRTCSASSRRRRDVSSRYLPQTTGTQAVFQGPFKVIDSGFGPLLAINTQARIVHVPQKEPSNPVVITRFLPNDTNRTPKGSSTKVEIRHTVKDAASSADVTHSPSSSGATYHLASSLLILTAMLVWHT